MKNLNKIFLLFFSLMLLGSSAEAQFIKKLKDAASKGMENAVEKKVEEEAEKMMMRQLEKHLAGLYGDDAESRPINLDMNKIFAGIGEEVDTEDAYSFTGHMVLELISSDAKGKSTEPMKIKTFLSPSSDYTGMELFDPKNPTATTKMILDIKNKASIILMDGEDSKSSFAFKMDLDELDSLEEKSFEESEFKIQKTGNTKEILGFDCEEYLVQSEDGQGVYWITEEQIANSNSFLSSNSNLGSSKMQEKYARHFANAPKGNVMEMEYKMNEGEEVKMKVIDIQTSQPITFEMSDYPSMMQSTKQ